MTSPSAPGSNPAAFGESNYVRMFAVMHNKLPIREPKVWFGLKLNSPFSNMWTTDLADYTMIRICDNVRAD